MNIEKLVNEWLETLENEENSYWDGVQATTREMAKSFVIFNRFESLSFVNWLKTKGHIEDTELHT